MMKGSSKAGKHSLLKYVESMIGSGHNIVYGNTMGCPIPLPTSFSPVNPPSSSNYRTPAGNVGSSKVRPVDQFSRSKCALPLSGEDKMVLPLGRLVMVAGYERIDEEDLVKAGLLGEVIVTVSE